MRTPHSSSRWTVAGRPFTYGHSARVRQVRNSCLRGFAITGIGLLFLLTAPFQVRADNGVEQWLDSAPAAAEYRPHREQLLDVFEAAAEKTLPREPLLRLLQEAGAKNVPVDTARLALTRELERLSTGDKILSKSGLRLEPEQRSETLANISLYLQSTLSQGVLEAVFHDQDSLEEPAQAAAALVRIKQQTRLGDEPLTRLAEALRRSELPVSGYRSLPAVFLQAQSWSVPTGEALEIVVRELDAGGGLVQINNALRRRRAR